MFNSIPHYILYPIAIAVSAVISTYSVRKILFITRSHKIYDIPDDTRKIHGAGIPSLGGIGIFIGFIAVAAFFWPGRPLYLASFMPSAILLFFTGVYDDLMNMRPSKKLVAQLLASAFTIYCADIRILSLHGLMGIGELPYGVSLAVSVLGCTLFINAFNFIDGIDGLACILSILYTAILGGLFAATLHPDYALVAFCLTGATAGLLVYNFSPARIYMGDTGSMLLGFTIFILATSFLHVYNSTLWLTPMNDVIKTTGLIHSQAGALLLVLSVLFLPVFDALRVFVLRAATGRSPLHADRTHLHYYLLDAGFSHSRAVLVIVTVNLLIIALAFLLQDSNPAVALLGMTAVAAAALAGVYMLRQRHLARSLA